jgi:hypothetical protein
VFTLLRTRGMNGQQDRAKHDGRDVCRANASERSTSGESHHNVAPFKTYRVFTLV